MTTLTELPRRLTAVWSKRGPRKFLLFVLGRILRLQIDQVYRCDLNAIALPCPTFADLELTIVDADNPPDGLPAALSRQLFAKEDAPLRAALNHRDALFFLVDGSNRVAHASWIFYRSSYKRLLNVADETPLIGNCETIEAWRGRRLYPKTLMAICHYLARTRRAREAVISCDPANMPSVRGIRRAGFVPQKRLISLIVLNNLVIQRAKTARGEARWRIFSMAGKA